MDDVKEKSNNEKEMCFFITPIGGKDTDIRRRANGLFSMVVQPIANEYGMDAVVAHKKDNTGDITSGIVNDIYKAKLVIADLTTLNPNVMYEIALRDAMKKPIILIAEEGTKLPFDIATMNTIMYTNDFLGTQELQESLRKRIAKINFENYKAVNLITQSEASISLYEEVELVSNPDVAQILKGILNEFEQFKQSTYSLANRNTPKVGNAKSMNNNTFRIDLITKNELDALTLDLQLIDVMEKYIMPYTKTRLKNTIILAFSECNIDTAYIVYNNIIEKLGNTIVETRKNF